MQTEQVDLLVSVIENPGPDKYRDARIALRNNRFWELHQKSGNRFVAYHEKSGKVLRFVKSLAIQKDQNVYLVVDEQERRWVLKWEMGNGHNIPDKNAEVAEYQRLEGMGAQCPKRLNGYRLFWFEVLVLEFLEPLDRDDNVIELARQLISTQLFYIHQYGCHSDLKIDNIRKRPPTKRGEKPLYFIIDMNLSKEKIGIGYRRELYTPVFASQLMPPYEEQASQNMITYKDDLLELFCVMNALFHQRAYESKTAEFADDKIEKTRNLLELKQEDFFADPIRMSKDAIYQTRRGYVAVQKMLQFGLRSSYYSIGALRSEFNSIQEIVPSRRTYRKLVRILGELQQDEGDYEDLRKEQDAIFDSQQRACIVCSSVTDYKCGYCYHSTTLLCENIQCRINHNCW